MPTRLLLLPALVLLTAPLAAQQADQSRVVITVGAGYVGGGELWTVTGQPLRVGGGFTDTLDLSRQLTSGLGVMFSGTYFPGDHFGFSGEALLLGLGSEDNCTVGFTTGSVETSEVCSSINHNSRGSTAVALSGGVVYRVASHDQISPYARLNLGFTVTQQSAIKMTGQHNTVDGPSDVPIYTDASPDRLHPYVGLALGVTAVAGKGYQLRLEVRDNYLRLPVPDGPTIHEALEPNTVTRGKHIFSLMLGFDVVLERKRGKRY